VSTGNACGRQDWAYALASEFPKLRFVLNGAIHSLDAAVALLQETAAETAAERNGCRNGSSRLGGVMVGRAAFYRPWQVDPHRNWLFTPELQWQSRGKRRISQGTVRVPLQYRLFTPESQWQSRGKRRISQGRHHSCWEMPTDGCTTRQPPR
jgi:tRNA-dihydrouridine synthase